MQSPDEEDFDQFLENVKARSLSVQKQGDYCRSYILHAKIYTFLTYEILTIHKIVLC